MCVCAYISLSSLTRLAVSLKVSSVGEKVPSFSRFVGLGGGTNGEGCGSLTSTYATAGSPCICNKHTNNSQTVAMQIVASKLL